MFGLFFFRTFYFFFEMFKQGFFLFLGWNSGPVFCEINTIWSEKNHHAIRLKDFYWFFSFHFPFKFFADPQPDP